MTTPIDIEVKDSVDGSIETKLASIARTARDGHKALQDLKKALSSLDTSELADLQRASASHTNALARELNAQARMTEATNKSATADARAALEKQKLATESQRTAAAEANAARAMSQSEAAAMRLSQAQARTAQMKSQDERAADQLSRAMTRLKMSIDPLAATLDRHNFELMEASRLYEAGAMDAATFASYQNTLKGRIDATTAAINSQNAATARGVMSNKHMTQATLNLSRQMADVGVTAAMGMNPFMILVQQAPQFADAFQTAGTHGLGFKQVLAGMFSIIGKLLLALAPLLVIVGAAAGAFGLFHRELSKGFPDDITEGMNLTEEQLERVESRTVTFGDTFASVFTVLGQRIMDSPIGDALRWIGQTAADVGDWIVTTYVTVASTMVGLLKGAFKTIMENWRQFPKAFGDMVISGVNAAIKAIEGLVNKAAEGLNFLIRSFNANPTNLIKLPEIGQVELGRLTNDYEGAGAALGEAFVTNVQSEIVTARQDMANFASDVGTEALRRARARALEEAGKPNNAGGNRGGQSEAEKRAEAIDEINAALEDELALMGMVGDALAIEARMQGIVNSMTQKGFELTDAEAMAILDKVTALQALSHVQGQLESIYEDATGAERDFQAGLTASKQLLDTGRISLDQYAVAVARLEYEHRMATDPMAAFNDELRDEAELIGKFGVQLVAANRLQSVRNDLLSKGHKLTSDEELALMRVLEQRERELMINDELGDLYDANQGAIEALTARTVALGLAHQQGVIGAEQYRIGLNNIAMEAANVAIRQNEMASSGQMALASLQSYMSTYQGMLPGLTQSFGDFFTTVGDGFANSIARSIVYAEDFGAAMMDVARTALTELISSLVKLGIQWLITQAIGNSMGAAATAASALQGSVVAAAWAPAAAAVSLATMGANAVPASAGMVATFGLAAALAQAKGMKDGGPVSGPGGPRSDKIPTMLSDGEYVINARATSENRHLLDAINSGQVLTRRADGGVVTASPSVAYRPAGSTNVTNGGTALSFDFSGANFGGTDPAELEERFARVVAEQMVPQILGQARKQANEDMTVRFVRPKI